MNPLILSHDQAVEMYTRLCNWFWSHDYPESAPQEVWTECRRNAREVFDVLGLCLPDSEE